MFGTGLRARAQAYHALAVALQSGLPAATAVELLARRHGAWGAWATEAARELERGADLQAVFACAPAIDPLERRWIELGIRTGTLPEILLQLAAVLEERATERSRLLARLAYPVLLLHMAVLLPPFGLVITEGLGAYLGTALPDLAALYAVGLFVFAALYSIAEAHRRSPAFARRLLRIPLLGGLLAAQSTARVARALAISLASGLGAFEAFELARDAAGSAATSEALERALTKLKAGASITEALRENAPPLAPVLVEFVETGERSGQLDSTLEKAARLLEEHARTRRAWLLRATGALIYLIAVLKVATTVVSFYTGL